MYFRLCVTIVSQAGIVFSSLTNIADCGFWYESTIFYVGWIRSFCMKSNTVLALAKVLDGISTARITVLISVASSFVYIFPTSRSERSSRSLK